MNYLLSFKSLVPEQEEIDPTKTYKYSKMINDKLLDSQDSENKPDTDDDVINELLDDNDNLQEKMILHDYGQGSLPYEGNCGFLIMSQFKFGYTNEYYLFCIFFFIPIQIFYKIA